MCDVELMMPRIGGYDMVSVDDCPVVGASRNMPLLSMPVLFFSMTLAGYSREDSGRYNEASFEVAQMTSYDALYHRVGAL